MIAAQLGTAWGQGWTCDLELGRGAPFWARARVRASSSRSAFSPQGAKYRGSIHDFPDFDASQDAEALYAAMKGFGGCQTLGVGSQEGGRWYPHMWAHLKALSGVGARW